MTTPDPTPDTEQDVQELTDENLEDVSGGAADLLKAVEVASAAVTATVAVASQGGKQLPSLGTDVTRLL